MPCDTLRDETTKSSGFDFQKVCQTEPTKRRGSQVRSTEETPVVRMALKLLKMQGRIQGGPGARPPP